MKSAPPVVAEPVASPLFDIDQARSRAREPERACRVPYLIPGFTDAKYFSQTGARWYGFCRSSSSSGVRVTRFADMFHGTDERVPVAGPRVGRRGARRRGVCARLPAVSIFRNRSVVA